LIRLMMLVAAGVYAAPLAVALIVTAASYLLFSLLGAFALLPRVGFWDGLFESMSGFTTTGLSVLDVGNLPVSVVFFRAFSQWVGGLGIVVISLLVLVGPGRSSFRLYASEFGEDNQAGDVRVTLREVGLIYLVLTGAGYLTYLLCGMGWLDALLHIMSSVSTGGFSSHGASIGHFPRILTQAATVPFMLLGAIGFSTLLRVRHGRCRALLRDTEAYVLLALVLLFAGLNRAGAGAQAGLFDDLFQGLSAVTTTGFSVVPYGEQSALARLLTVALMVIGGSAGSTAGGIKLVRLILLVKLVRCWSRQSRCPPPDTNPWMPCTNPPLRWERWG
jgi:trk system potassium uptake protein